MSTKWYFFSILLILVPRATTHAQSSNTDTIKYILPLEIVVSAPRISAPLREMPFSVSIVEHRVLHELARSVSMDEPLKLVPGVKVDNQANGNRVHLSIRGQGILTERGIRGIQFLYDGIPLNDPTGFAPDLFDIDLSTVERIEVLRGAAASLYGGSASGGILNVISQNPPLTTFSGKAQLTYGSNNFRKGFGQVGGNLRDVIYAVSFSRMLGDGYRDHTHFMGNNLYGRVRYTPTNSFSINAITGWTDVYHENPEGITLQQYRDNPKLANPDAIPFDEFLETSRLTNAVTGMVILNENHQFQFNGYVKSTKFTEANNRTFNFRSISTAGASLQYSFRTGSLHGGLGNQLDVGTDLQWQGIDEHRVDNLHSIPGDTIRSRERIRQHSHSLFLIDKVDVTRELKGMLSVRYDRIQNELDDLLKNPYDVSGSADFEKTTKRIGLTFSALENLNIYAIWGEGFLPPATEELAQNPERFGGFNRELTNATSNECELGIRGTLFGDLYFDVTGFILDTENDFDRYRITDPLRSQETFYRNAGSSHRFGLEFFSRSSITEDLHIQLAYTFSHFTYANTLSQRVPMDDPTVVKYVAEGNWLPNSPRHQFDVDVEYAPAMDVTLGLSIEALSKSYIDGANVESEAAEGYALVHARIAGSWHMAGMRCELSVHVRNLGDRKYIAFTEPDPGGNAYQPGAGREFFLGMMVNF